jgi:NADH-quinone oxidoreductase subunit I
LEISDSGRNFTSIAKRIVEDADDMSEYWKNIKTTTKTLKEGLKVTLKHAKDARNSRDVHYPDKENYFDQQNGLFTTQYPHEKLPVPDHGRYKLHNEIDDCIVCDKCAKVCPVNCIDIEPVRSVEEIGKTSDGTSKRIFAAKFDIDMAKCCFCGLCTTVCPTECLTMTDEYDFSAYDFAEHNFAFGEMTPLEILQRKQELEEFNKKKAAEKAARTAETPARPRPAGMPKIKPATAAVTGERPKPAFRPRVVPKKSADDSSGSTPKPVMKPKVVVKPGTTSKTGEEKKSGAVKPKMVKPKVGVKPEIPVTKKPDTHGVEETKDKEKTARPKVVLKPKIPVKPKIPSAQKKDTESAESTAQPKAAKPKIPARPKIPIKKKENPENDSEQGGAAE